MNQTGKAILDDIPEVILENLTRKQTSNQAESYE
jgi:predicted house-cleaning noncanonical NTP pyrophosphatase (MazG superfamily)